VTLPEPETFLSGVSGTRTGLRRVVTGALCDMTFDLLQALSGTNRDLDRLAEAEPSRRVLVLSAYRRGELLRRAVHELSSQRHDVTLAFAATGEADPALESRTLAVGLTGGKFENLNRLLADLPAPVTFDWTLIVDDDVALPTRFLDRFTALAGRLALDLAQPAQTRRSHAAWQVTRRRPASVARQTRFVEIGPVTAFRSTVAEELLPFPPLRFGWGLDVHWAALAEERNWRLGILDALPVRHERGAVASSYDRTAAIEEGRRFLTTKQYLPSAAAHETLVMYRRVPLHGLQQRR
jgi:hypothetical protein